MTLNVNYYFHTVRHLKPIQIYFRIVRRFYRPALNLAPSPELAAASGEWAFPAPKVSSMTDPCKFNILKKDFVLYGRGAWNDPELDRLRLYNLHYFDDLNSSDAAEKTDWHNALIERWIDENPPASGVGWEPYPVSVRLVNWMKWAMAGNKLSEKAVYSLCLQARWLFSNFEYHLLANHLFANAKALVFAGCFFSGVEAEKWFNYGMSVLGRETKEQILPDGGHFERSPMYHSIILEDMLDLINLSNCYAVRFAAFREELDSWSGLSGRMIAWLKTMCHPDGEISFFNDASTGVAATPDNLFKYAKRLGLDDVNVLDGDFVWLRDSGYVRIERDDAVLIADVAPVGPDYQPGHAHADTLSFELSVHGQRVIVNSGTSCYGLGPDRERERSTAAHSTVEINGCNSSEVWSGFRVARRAFPFDVSMCQDKGDVVVEAAHDGYRRLTGRPVHRRFWRLGGGCLMVNDSVEGSCSRAVSRIYFHPDVLLSRNNDKGTLRSGAEVYNWEISGGVVNDRKSLYASGFGELVSGTCLETEFQTESTFCISWRSAP